MDNDNRPHIQAWVPLRDLHKTIRRELPKQSPHALVRVMDAMQDNWRMYRIRCKPGDNQRHNPNRDPWAMSFGEDDTVLQHMMTTTDWDTVDPAIGLFRTYVIEVRWVEVLNLLEQGSPAPAGALASKQPTPKQKQAEDECRAWFEGYMRQSRDTPLGKRQAWHDEARKLWPLHLTKAGRERAWKDAMTAAGAHAWGNKGQQHRLPMPKLNQPAPNVPRSIHEHYRRVRGHLGE